MKTDLKSVGIYPKYIQRINEKVIVKALGIIQQINKDLTKLENEFVSIEEFSQYTRLK